MRLTNLMELLNMAVAAMASTALSIVSLTAWEQKGTAIFFAFIAAVTIAMTAKTVKENVTDK